ncbi:two-component system OmpR family response regulator [Rhizobium sp. BK196]|jgi:DNA-binding response OmpR family regulator|uniref:response regulator transcription factor n=1 Tax=unclassified Rhizobium TaxID=2613769 RepID=UPI001613254E|nr:MULTISPECIES: response regulator transcription factor [unclassified Rhizobium]MBB3310074.1 two-component system OmpR family response regulator [Rhizobium sp. BK196]MBB3462555.1 two-component system OmpR family response regulator [Rhizobium sp. BK377]
MRVLLAEDEPEMAAVLVAALRCNNIITDHVSTIEAAEEAVRLNSYDALLLDRSLPDGDGLELIADARRIQPAVPVIMLTARGDLKDRIEGLDLGADDYLAKPFAVEELMARLRAILRRPGNIEIESLRLGRLHFDLRNREARVGDMALELPRRELLVLEALMRRAGRTVERSSLEEAVYGMDDEIQSNALDAHVSRVRRKLDAAGAGVEIHTIRGVGYLIRQARS